MSLHVDAKRRDISRRLQLAREDEVDVVDQILLQLELCRDLKGVAAPILNIEGSDLERSYRRGHNDAMRSETPQIMVWRARVILTTRAADVERGLKELQDKAPQPVERFDFDVGGEG